MSFVISFLQTLQRTSLRKTVFKSFVPGQHCVRFVVCLSSTVTQGAYISAVGCITLSRYGDLKKLQTQLNGQIEYQQKKKKRFECLKCIFDGVNIVFFYSFVIYTYINQLICSHVGLESHVAVCSRVLDTPL